MKYEGQMPSDGKSAEAAPPAGKPKSGIGAWWDKWLAGRLLPVFTTLLALGTGWVGLSSSWQKQDIDAQKARLDHLNVQIDSTIKQSQNERAARESTERLQITLYEHVQKVLAQKEQPNDERVTRAAAVLVTHLAQGEFRSGLLEALKANALTESTRREVQYQLDEAEKYERERTRDAEQRRVAVAAAVTNDGRVDQPRRWANWDFDFFWCEAIPAAQKTAEEALMKVKSLDPNATGRWRVRMLTKERNASAGYDIRGNVIRRDINDPAEARMVEALQTALQTTAGRKFDVNDSSQGTKWYISVFFCGS